MKYAMLALTLMLALVAFAFSVTSNVSTLLFLLFIPNIMQSLPWGLIELEMDGVEEEDEEGKPMGFTAKI